MKILYLHQYFKFPHEPGGTRSFDLATSFIKLGHQVEVISSTSDASYKTSKNWFKVSLNGLTVHYIYLPYNNNLNYFHRTIVFLKFLWLSTFKVISIKCDLILSTSTPLTIGIPALIKKFFHKTNFIFETRDIWPEAVIAIGAINNNIIKKILYFLEYIIYKNAKYIVPLSIDMKASIISRFPEYDKKILKIIENISEINRFQKGYEEKNFFLKKKIGFQPRFTVLYAGTFGRVNGISYIIDLASKIYSLDPSIVFVLIGDGVEKKTIIKQAKEKNILDKNIFILNSVSKKELPQLYYECDMGSSFVIPIKELWANSANKYFDTLAAGKPILINYEGWQKVEILNEDVGYVLPIKTDDKAIKGFISYTKNTLLHTRQKENALNLAKKRYSLNKAVEKYQIIFDKLKN